MIKKPTILERKTVAQTRLFRIEQLELEFSNHALRSYERLGSTHSPGSVMIVALNDQEQALLVREYCAGVDRYELGLPKGKIDSGETMFEAANRELQEEAGYGANKLHSLAPLTLAPAYMSQSINVVIAWDLYPQRLEGDEPEQMEVVPWELDSIHALVASGECTEARSIAALYLTADYLRQQQTEEFS